MQNTKHQSRVQLRALNVQKAQIKGEGARLFTNAGIQQPPAALLSAAP